MVIISLNGCAISSFVPSYEPPRCPDLRFDKKFIDQYEQLIILSDKSQNGMFYNTLTNEPIIINVDMIDKVFGEHHKHCKALDAYLKNPE